MIWFRCAVAAIALASIVACGGGGDNRADSPDGTTPPSPQSTAAGFASLSEARSEYLRLLEPSGVAAERVSDLLDRPDAAVADVRQAVLAYADATQATGQGLQARTWPDEVAAPVGLLAEQLLAQDEPLRRAAEGSTTDLIAELLSTVPPATAAEDVRDAFKQAGA